MKINNKSFFCSAPFLHMSSNTKGDWLPCCTAQNLGYSIYDTSLLEFYDSQEMRRMRKEFATGEISDWLRNICQNCIKREKQSGISKRIKDLSLLSGELKNQLKDSIKEIKLGKKSVFPKKISSIKLKIFGNFCNFKCLMCSPECSSSYTLEMNKYTIDHPFYKKYSKLINLPVINPFQDIDGKKRDKLIRDLSFVIPKCERLEITGGEPTINSSVWSFLEELKNSVNVKGLELSIGTNLSFDFSQKLLGISKYFRKVTIYISIDAIGQRADFIRFGCNFKNIEKNIFLLNEVKKNSNIHPIISVTLQSLNIGYVGEIYDWSKKINIPIVYYNIVVNPNFLMIQNLPKSIKEGYIEKIESHPFLSQSKWKDIFLLSLTPEIETNNFSKLISFLKKMDAIRKTDYMSLWPEFKLN